MYRWVITGSWLSNNDYGDMFLNFPLSLKMRKYVGIIVYDNDGASKVMRSDGFST